jgi:hypothetical protein
MPGVDLDKLEASPTAARSHLDIVGIIRMALLDFEHTVALEIMFFDAECDQCSFARIRSAEAPDRNPGLNRASLTTKR